MKHKDEIEILVVKYKPRILRFTETHITEKIEDTEISKINYDILRCNTYNCRTGRVINYIRRDIKYKIICNKNQRKTWVSAIKLEGKYSKTLEEGLIQKRR